MSALKDPRAFIATLIDSIQHTQSNEQPTLASLDTKKHLFTLHVLFQRELIPALDLLDRKAVTRLRLADTTECTYYVRSAQQTSARGAATRHRTAEFDATPYYEVRLKAWSCSCPAFVFSAFPATMPTARDDRERTAPCKLGELTRESHVPMCKHILACVLIENGGASIEPANDRTVTVEELAGWAAGWGD